MPVNSFEFMTLAELAGDLGARLRDCRIARGLEQEELAARAGISGRTLRNLERGQGSSLETFLRTLKALGLLGGLSALAPRPSVDPMALLKQRAPRKRVRKKRKEGGS